MTDSNEDIANLAQYTQEFIEKQATTNEVVMNKLLIQEAAITELRAVIDGQATRIERLEDSISQLIEMFQEEIK